MATVYDLLTQHSTNVVHNTHYVTQSNKEWARNYHPIRNLVVHSYHGGDGLVHADFDSAFLGSYEDDGMRMDEPAMAPNKRIWRLECEADCELWFHTEVSNVVLAGWNRYPQVTQTSHTKPPRVENIPEEVDAMYTIKYRNERTVIAIGEMKRNLIQAAAWQAGNVLQVAGQKMLSRELRGYAVKYQSPQVYCFDGKTLLLLQFRADTPAKMMDADCPVDCWVLPREGSFYSLRYALYRLMAQGFRRFQGMCALPISVGGLTPRSRRFFNGVPVWHPNGVDQDEHPGGYVRSVNGTSGAVKWTHSESGDLVWETAAFWGEHA
ncbi:uncharacterized protein THITE_2171159 [Thermothielavioides terrestris NRRL 8126]|uniref:Uncharacterized protein n=1 Tax=Thermothielavioides terrestris (strain ATCC 38088 / NRRL 8126) TaxID=578455 RepID=G2RDH0_THETT|nr:uncharacterized protein THITE_2171159 [Thermothielavioides terrestris NRRL 8126]AEO69952.1 hypothetical protein THITE_2171159 [Thermothielavioides terrestris NRRL 8126]